MMTREDGLTLLTAHIKSESLTKHMLAVEAAMRGYAARFGEDERSFTATGATAARFAIVFRGRETGSGPTCRRSERSTEKASCSTTC